MRRLVIALGALLLAVGASAAGGYAWLRTTVTTPVAPGDETERIFEVPKGASLSRVADKLAAEGLIRSASAVRLWIKLKPAPAPKAGRHALAGSMSAPQILEALSGTPLSEDVPLAMVEGWRRRDADAWLAANGWIEAGAWLAATADPTKYSPGFALEADSLEGYLLPDTYAVPKGPLDVPRLVQRQLDAFRERFVEPHADEIVRSGRSLNELVVMASMLEREEPDPLVRPNVAGILWKRIDARTPLGVDATSRYTLDDWSDRKAFLKKLRDPSDPYNTRLKVGLPPGAIGAPSLPSLLAALRPVASEYWYYLHDKDQNIRYARNAAEHEANRKKYDVY
jgi:UPF0755 protein